jgi:multidrug resistance efflux pump
MNGSTPTRRHRDTENASCYVRASVSARFISLVIFICLLIASGCHSSANKHAATDLVVVKATQSGVVQRVLVNEGTNVNEGATLIEIAVPVEPSSTNQNQAEAQARAAISRTQHDISDAEAEVNRAAVEVQRVEPLVASGAAPQAQLDAARSQYQQAQERLQRVRESAAAARSRAVVAASSNSPAQPAAQTIVAVSAPAAGNVRVISVRAGQRVTAGQAIATVSTSPR